VGLENAMEQQAAAAERAWLICKL